jgi:hypothetical protein
MKYREKNYATARERRIKILGDKTMEGRIPRRNWKRYHKTQYKILNAECPAKVILPDIEWSFMISDLMSLNLSDYIIGSRRIGIVQRPWELGFDND